MAGKIWWQGVLEKKTFHFKKFLNFVTVFGKPAMTLPLENSLCATESTLTLKSSILLALIEFIALAKIDFVSGECNFGTSSCFGRGQVACLTFG